MLRLERSAGSVVGRLGRRIGLAGLARSPPVVMGVDELGKLWADAPRGSLDCASTCRTGETSLSGSMSSVTRTSGP